jgi:hypothetical protein
MEVQGLFVGLDSATLATMKTEWLACLSAIATNQSYSVANRTLTRADLKEVKATIREITFAQQSAAGTLRRTTYTDMSHG